MTETKEQRHERNRARYLAALRLLVASMEQTARELRNSVNVHAADDDATVKAMVEFERLALGLAERRLEELHGEIIDATNSTPNQQDFGVALENMGLA